MASTLHEGCGAGTLRTQPTIGVEDHLVLPSGKTVHAAIDLAHKNVDPVKLLYRYHLAQPNNKAKRLVIEYSFLALRPH